MNFDLKVKEILKETYILTSKIKDKEIINNLIRFIKNYSDLQLSRATHVKGNFTGFDSLIQNLDFINFIKKIQNNIQVVYKDSFKIKDAWANICKKEDEVTEHDHNGTTGFCGILYLTEGGPGTYFKEYDLTVSEEVGKFILFHPFLKHSVSKIKNDIERITVAFNIDEIKIWENKSNINWIDKNEI